MRFFRWRKPKKKIIDTPNDNRQQAIIVDLDDTLAIVDNVLGLTRRWEMFIPQAKVNPWCRNIVKVYSQAGYQVIFLTARLEIYRDITIDWLESNNIYPYQYKLFMYPGDHYAVTTSLAKFKSKLIQKDILPHYFVHFAIDDNLNNVAAINKLGIKCLHC